MVIGKHGMPKRTKAGTSDTIDYFPPIISTCLIFTQIDMTGNGAKCHRLYTSNPILMRCHVKEHNTQFPGIGLVFLDENNLLPLRINQEINNYITRTTLEMNMHHTRGFTSHLFPKPVHIDGGIILTIGIHSSFDGGESQ